MSSAFKGRGEACLARYYANVAYPGIPMPTTAKSHKKVTIALGTILVLGLCGIVPYTIVHECNQKNELPDIEIYPTAQQVRQSIRSYGIRHMAILDYVTQTSRAELIAYFDRKFDCRFSESHESMTCLDASPGFDGEVFVYVSDDDTDHAEEMRFTAEIRWKGCTWNLEMTE